MQKLILIGGGGHCHACIDVIESTNQYEIIGIIDTKDKVGQTVLGYPIIGSDDETAQFINENTWFLITVGHIQSSNLKNKLFENLKKLNANIATVVSPHAIVSRHSQIEKGTIVMHKATVGPNTKIGENCIINTGADVEHDCLVGENCHISTHAILNGACEVAENSFIGSNSTLFHGVKICENVTLSAGSIVRKSIKKSGIYLNNQFIK
jgi:sugar O-acyltransferase (sialic acid O-acetyltransferase NeuD family)